MKLMQKTAHLGKSFATAVKSKFSAAKAACATALSLAMASPIVAHAAGAADLGAAAEGQLSGAETIVLGLLVTLIGIVFLFVLYNLIKKAK